MTTELDDFLGNHSSLTKRQIECINLQISARNRTRDGSKSERPHNISGVSEGAYYRVLGQAKANVDQALYTILLCSRLGIIDGADFSRLLNLINRAPSDASESSKEVMSLVDALVRKIVML